VSVLAEISDFFGAMSTMFEGFTERIERVYQVLRGKRTAFVLVSSPEEQVLEEAEYLSRRMAELGVSLRAVVFNRVHQEFAGPIDPRLFPRGDIRTEDLERISSLLIRGGIEAELAARLSRNFVAYQDLARGDALRVEQFTQGLSKRIPVVEVPNFAEDLHDLRGLRAMHPCLFGES
ncbi:MAG: hypothetical protein QOD06_706, partial [Candidatus Binatota bacterium]|nr:hypothetical protein [Candidatus Binatota bacterium]